MSRGLNVHNHVCEYDLITHNIPVSKNSEDLTSIDTDFIFECDF